MFCCSALSTWTLKRSLRTDKEALILENELIEMLNLDSTSYCVTTRIFFIFVLIEKNVGLDYEWFAGLSMMDFNTLVLIIRQVSFGLP